MAHVIRVATEADAGQIAEIYAPFVSDNAVSFELVPPTASEMAQRVSSALERYPWLVSARDGAVTGYAYASLYLTREAYQWSVDSSVYIHEKHRGQGVGKALYTSLFACLRLLGYYNVYAGVTLPNDASVALHESVGFSPVGVYRHVGYKFGEWHDVGWWELALQDRIVDPAPPRLAPDAVDSPQWREALAEGERLLRD
jgi:L-amino acid N-acyltransferase YncA